MRNAADRGSLPAQVRPGNSECRAPRHRRKAEACADAPLFQESGGQRAALAVRVGSIPDGRAADDVQRHQDLLVIDGRVFGLIRGVVSIPKASP
jgi:hypothetical protein